MTTVAWPRPRPRRLLQPGCLRSLGHGLCSRCLFLLCFLVVAFAASSSSAGRVVTSLPGFDGDLPFHLETGYVEVDEDAGVELFYYFVRSESESESGAASDAPFLFWLTGGDRCSVFSGLAYEIGPIRFVLEPYNGTLPRLRYNQNSWSKVSHILFVDSPVGAGFSFSRDPKGYDVGDISSTLQLRDFLIKWFGDHPEYLANPFYIGGDSYAGKNVPFLGQMISEGIEVGSRLFPNLKGYLVGNAVTGESIDSSSQVPYAHGVGIISDQLYETILGHCQGEDYTNPANALCAQALDTFNSTYGYYLSYFWANDKRTREALRIKKGTVDEWVRCHDGDLPYTKDLESAIKYHRNLTSRGYRALVYSGDHDLMVPHLGTQAWVRSLNFPIVDEWRAWHLGGQAAGFTISYSNNMTFATIKGGGHTAPEYEPERCFAMFSRWILNNPL